MVLSSWSEDDDLVGESMCSHFLSLAEDLDCHRLSLPDFLVSLNVCSSEIGSRLILCVW